MKIKAVCEATGLTDRTVRYYIEENLISPAYTENYLGRKAFDFSESDIRQLADIAVLRKFGFSVAEIRDMRLDPGCIIRIARDLQSRKQDLITEENRLLQALQRLEENTPCTVSDLAACLSAPVVDTPLPAEDGQWDVQKIVRTEVTNILGLIAGLFLTLLFGGFLLAGEFVTLDDRLACAFFTCFGIFITLLCILSMAVNRKAFIRVDEEHISAFCHYGLKLDCGLSEIRSVSYDDTWLNIQLANGRRYNLMNLKNAHILGRYIEKRIPRRPRDTLSQELLMAQIPPLRKQCRREGIGAMVGFPLLIPLVILTSALTGWRELHQFSARDWTVFGILGAVGVVLITVSCLLLRKFLLHIEQLHHMEGSLYQLILRTAPLLPGNALGLYLDHEDHASIRLTVFGFPGKEEVCYTIEQVNRVFEIECIHKSYRISQIRELEPMLGDMTEIPLPGESQITTR